MTAWASIRTLANMISDMAANFLGISTGILHANIKEYLHAVTNSEDCCVYGFEKENNQGSRSSSMNTWSQAL